METFGGGKEIRLVVLFHQANAFVNVLTGYSQFWNLCAHVRLTPTTWMWLGYCLRPLQHSSGRNLPRQNDSVRAKTWLRSSEFGFVLSVALYSVVVSE